MRDNFKKADLNELARLSGYRCSNPSCKRVTVGPDGDDGTASIGVAAHICAASAGGPRYNVDMATNERSSIENGIWLCQTCSRLIDVDVPSHPIELLHEWKKLSQIRAYLALHNLDVVQSRSFNSLEQKMPELIAEMRQDLLENPFTREFVLLSKKWIYNGSEKTIFTYFFEDHEHLQEKMTVCENYGAIVETTHNNVDRYEFTEDFAEYLEGTS